MRGQTWWKSLTAVCCLLALLASCGQKTGDDASQEQVQWEDIAYDHSLDLAYAQNFSVDYYAGGFALINITDGGRYLVVPEDKSPPAGLDEEVTVLQQPLNHIYLLATSAMDLFCSLDALDTIQFVGVQPDGWHLEEAREAMLAGRFTYAGKYNAPDYERILSGGCDLAVESTMIYHTPEVKEKLEDFGIPVLVERSSYEPHPLGRTEWMKLYGVLLGKEELAETLVERQAAQLESVASGEGTGKTAAFFYINNSGAVNVRKSADYVSKMIELAGGTYVFAGLGDEETALSTVNLQMEEFYAKAKDADVLLYNSTIDGGVKTLEDLYEKSPLLKDFKAVKTGNVWCTAENMFQSTTHLGDMIVEFHQIFQGNAPDTMTYLYHLS